MRKNLLIVGIIILGSLSTYAQITLPPNGGNQKSVVTQYIGALAHVTFKYNSPDVTSPQGQSREGQIWGQLVPYGMAPNNFGSASEIPWRAGANESTIVKLSHDMLVNGHMLDAGKYSLHIIPQETGQWTVIFSNDVYAWGSFFYDESNDALRVKATPEECAYTEWMTYEFIDRKPDNATVALRWERLQLPINFSVPNLDDLYISHIDAELTGEKGFTWTNWNAAANYCLQNNSNFEKGLEWAEASISAPFVGQANFATLSTKAALLGKLEKTDEMAQTMMTAVDHPTATILQIHQVGRQLIAAGMPDMALKVFEKNVEKFGDVWPTHVGMARGLAALGKYKDALEHAEIALEQAPDDLNRDNLRGAIEKLKNDQDIN
jgi:tetratricopeptide (TPR) repeat protein